MGLVDPGSRLRHRARPCTGRRARAAVRRLAGRIGQRPILIFGGIAYALGGAYRLVMLGLDESYAIDYLPSMLLTGVGVACCFPQLSSVVAQSLPPNRIGICGASLQAIRQFGGTFGVALTIAFLGARSGGDPLAAFDRMWWLIVAGGIATSLLVVPMRTAQEPARNVS